VFHRFSIRPDRAGIPALLLALMVVLAACGGQQPTINPDNAVSITRASGGATLVRAVGGSQSDLPDNVLLAPGDQLYTAPDQTVTLQFPDGSTLQMGSDSRLQLLSIRPVDRVAVFRLLAGSVTGRLRGDAFEVQGYREVAMNFRMVVAELIAVPRGAAGTYWLGFDGDTLKGTVNAGEFDLRSGNQQATLPLGWQAIAEPGKPLQIISLITPTPAPPSATEAPTATPIQIISITLTNTPEATRTSAATATSTLTRTPTRAPTRVPPQITNTQAPTAAPTIVVDTPVPTATPKPPKPPTDPPPPPTNPPPPPTDPPPPTNPPPTTDRPTPTSEPPTPGG
jgi:hypothetical protein